MNMMPGTQEFVKQLPTCVEAEQEIIGQVLMRNNLYEAIGTILEADFFSEPVHKQIWRVMEQQIQAGRAATPITLRAYLGNAQLDPSTNVVQYLGKCVSSVIHFESIRENARIIRDMALRRQIIYTAMSVIDRAYDAPVTATAETLFLDMETEIEGIRPAMQVQGQEYTRFDQIESTSVMGAYQRGGELTGVSTGLPKLDDLLGGMHEDDLIIIGGRPGAGKTALATAIAVAAARAAAEARAAGRPVGEVAFHSLEMSDQQLKTRIISDVVSVPGWKYRRGIADREEMQAYVNADRDLRKLPLSIDPTPGLSISQIRMRCRNLKKKRGLSLVVIDYVQLMKGSRRHNSRAEEVSEVTAGLKEMAKELKVPVIALSQLSRDVDKRDDKRPQLADLRESGSIEQDADVVLFVFREEYYLAKSPPIEGTPRHAEWSKEMKKVEGIAQAICAKNRHGPEGAIVLGFDGAFTRFTNDPAPREAEPEEYRERAAKMPAISNDAKVLYGLLKNLTTSRGVAVTKEQRDADRRLCAGARLIPLEDCRKAFGAELYPTDDDAKHLSKLKVAAKSLIREKLALFHGRPEDQATPEIGVFMWLPEMAVS